MTILPPTPLTIPPCRVNSVWVFGYGSLMWFPGFPYIRKVKATLRGYHRSYCMLSTKNRGTKDSPGMMLGLLPGGVCEALAFEVAADSVKTAFEYLDKREGEGIANRKVLLPLQIDCCEHAAMHHAWTYLPMRAYENYLGQHPVRETAEKIVTGRGETGTSYEYLKNLVDSLKEWKISEPEMVVLLDTVEKIQDEKKESV